MVPALYIYLLLMQADILHQALVLDICFNNYHAWLNTNNLYDLHFSSNKYNRMKIQIQGFRHCAETGNEVQIGGQYSKCFLLGSFEA